MMLRCFTRLRKDGSLAIILGFVSYLIVNVKYSKTKFKFLMQKLNSVYEKIFNQSLHQIKHSINNWLITYTSQNITGY